jgi:hypothetical protein
MKKRLTWFLLLWVSYIILVIFDWKNLKYFSNLIKELHKLIKKNSKYTEDGDFILIPKPKPKDL